MCVEVARGLAKRVAAEIGVPAFLYEDAALVPEHRDLAVIRKGGFEELREVIATDPARRPDEGEPRVHPTAGVVAIGARSPLIAFNVNLDSDDLELAQAHRPRDPRARRRHAVRQGDRPRCSTTAPCRCR